MKTFIFSIFFIFSGLMDGQLVVSPAGSPVVREGGSLGFTANMPVKWSLAPGSVGSIGSDGVYHAPSSISPKQKVAGCQLLPNDHIFNTRIDALPLHPQSANWMAMLPSGRLSISPAWGINIGTNVTPLESMVFLYTPKNNGQFPIPPYPDFQVQGGYFVGLTTPADVDKHSIVVNRDTCAVSELYGFYNAGMQSSCPTCRAQSGTLYPSMSYALSGATDAAGLQLAALMPRLEEIRSGAIRHAIRFTLSNSYIARSFAWPATTNAYPSGQIPYGSRFRLRAGFNISGFSPTAQILLTAMKQYGMILADGGLNFDLTMMNDTLLDPTVAAAFAEIQSGAPSSKDFEVVDESSLEVSSATGQVKIDNGHVKPDDYAEVVATSVTDPTKTAQVRVALQALAVGIESPGLWIQSGVTRKLSGWTTGTSNGTLIWSSSPSGAVTSDGVFTAPAVASPTRFTVNATSAADPLASAQTVVTIMPAGPIRIDVGNSSDYTDSKGNKWWADQAFEADSPVTANEVSAPWPNTSDIALYKTTRYSWGDYTYRFIVPNGQYKITLMIGEAVPIPDGYYREFDIETQGKIVVPSFNLKSYPPDTPVTVDIPAEVTDGALYFTLRRRVNHGSISGLNWPPILNAFVVMPNTAPSAPAVLSITPSAPVIASGASQQFSATLNNASYSNVSWSVSPSLGTITPTGFYTAPAATVDTKVTIKAVSAADSTLVATAVATVKAAPAAPAASAAIRVNCGSSTTFTDAQGRQWAADHGYSDGTVAWSQNEPIVNATADMQRLYTSSRYRYANQSWYYSFPVPNGVYTVTLKFAEYVFTTPGHHYFDVKINGATVIDGSTLPGGAGPGAGWDPAAAAGPRTAIDKSFIVNVANGSVRIDLIGHAGGALINGIEIIPTAGGTAASAPAPGIAGD